MAMTPVYNPKVPSTIDLNGMYVGKSIYVFGVVKQDPDRFAINLLCGPNQGDDIALHFNPRFRANTIVRNTKTGGSWGPEEKDGGLPMNAGGIFGVTILCHKEHFEIKVNKYRVFTTYKHRIPYCNITHLSLAGDCNVKVVAGGLEGFDIPTRVFTNPPKPVTFEIPFHNIKGRSITFVGKPTTSNGRFSFNFTSADREINHFHFNPRMDQGQIVRNTKKGGWGAEERELAIPFPFKEGVPFQLKISVEPKRFLVELNGSELLEYKKRIPTLKEIRRVTVSDNVHIDKICCV